MEVRTCWVRVEASPKTQGPTKSRVWRRRGEAGERVERQREEEQQERRRSRPSFLGTSWSGIDRGNKRGLLPPPKGTAAAAVAAPRWLITEDLSSTRHHVGPSYGVAGVSTQAASQDLAGAGLKRHEFHPRSVGAKAKAVMKGMEWSLSSPFSYLRV